MKRVVLWVCTLLMTLMASVCVAGTYSPYFATEPPQEVLEHIQSRWADYELRIIARFRERARATTALRCSISRASASSSVIIG